MVSILHHIRRRNDTNFDQVLMPEANGAKRSYVDLLPAERCTSAAGCMVCSWSRLGMERSDHSMIVLDQAAKDAGDEEAGNEPDNEKQDDGGHVQRV